MDNIGKIDLVNHNEYEKSAIFMRMSDDLLSLLENYALNQNDSSSKLTIKFDDSNGVITMPNGEVFSFSVTGSTAGHNSTYCIQETENRALETVALVQPQKIIIKPSDDSFEKTRTKLAYQRKINICSEVEMLDSFTKIGGKKVTVKCPSSLPEVANSININGNKNKKFTSKKNVDIMSQCVRKRIIHMLALKPCKRSELLDRLVKEGVSESEKRQVYPLLYYVGTLKKEIFHLDTKFWKEVEDDWRFYSPGDAAIVKKRKQEICHKDVNLVLKNPPSKECSLVNRIIPSFVPIQKKQKKTRVKGKKTGFNLGQYGVMDSTTKYCPNSASEPKESDYQVVFFPSSKEKHKKNRERKRKKNKSLGGNSGEKSSTVINETKPALKDSCMKRSLMDEIVVNSGPIQKKQKETKVNKENPGHSLGQYVMINTRPKNSPNPASESTESCNQVTFPPPSYKKHKKNKERKRKKNKKGLLPLNNSEKKSGFPSTFINKTKHVLLKNSISRTQELFSPSTSAHSASASSSSLPPSVSSFTHSSAALFQSQSAYAPSPPHSTSISHSTSAHSSSQSVSAPSSSQSASAPYDSASAFPPSHSASASPPSCSAAASVSNSTSAFPPSHSAASVSNSTSASPPSHSAASVSNSTSASPPSHSAASVSNSTSASPPSHSAAAASVSNSTSASPSLQSPSVSSSHSALSFSLSTSASSSLQSQDVSSSSHHASARYLLRKMYKILATQSAKQDTNDVRGGLSKITSFEQREMYKDLFDDELPVYEAFREHVIRAQNIMEPLENNVKALSEGTQEYVDALKALYRVYKMYFQLSNLVEISHLCYHLGKELSDLRNRILEFDVEHSKIYSIS